ncbi:2-iminobutanoate/2-iminopropanoate deaminase [Buchnera aphidicola (Thelaxes suberi)]|uniref:Rid family detoxifying hydrolase n=1 Tax=Buchnera aphidicola TaxID=9 RepID=UPI0034645957
MSIKIIHTKKSPHPIGPYNQGIQINNILFISGQIPIDTKNNTIPDDIAHQTKIVLLNIESILHKANFYVKNIVKTTIFLTNIQNIQQVNNIYTSFFEKHNSNFPARSCVEVSKLPKNVEIEIEAIAIK